MISSVCSRETTETPRGVDLKVTAGAAAPPGRGWVLGRAGLCGTPGPSRQCPPRQVWVAVARQAHSPDLVQPVGQQCI